MYSGSFDSASKIDNWSQEYTDAEVRSGAQYQSLVAQFYGSESYYMFGTDGEWTPGESVYIVNMPQHEFGENVRPKSFNIVANAKIFTSTSVSEPVDAYFYDDGHGRVLERYTGARVGDIVYGLGVAFLNRLTYVTSSTVLIESGSTPIEFKPILTGSILLTQNGMYLADFRNSNDKELFGTTFAWYTCSYTGTGESDPLSTYYSSPSYEGFLAQVAHTNNDTLQLQVCAVGDSLPETMTMHLWRVF